MYHDHVLSGPVLRGPVALCLRRRCGAPLPLLLLDLPPRPRVLRLRRARATTARAAVARATTARAAVASALDAEGCDRSKASL